MVPDVLSIQPLASVPVTVYVVVAGGESLKDAPDVPLFHVYELAPAAVMVPLAPIQIVASVMVITGGGLTVTATVVGGETQEPTVTVSVISLEPLLGQLTEYGPCPLPESTVPVPKLQA